MMSSCWPSDLLLDTDYWKGRAVLLNVIIIKRSYWCAAGESSIFGLVRKVKTKALLANGNDSESLHHLLDLL